MGTDERFLREQHLQSVSNMSDHKFFVEDDAKSKHLGKKNMVQLWLTGMLRGFRGGIFQRAYFEESSDVYVGVSLDGGHFAMGMPMGQFYGVIIELELEDHMAAIFSDLLLQYVDNDLSIIEPLTTRLQLAYDILSEAYSFWAVMQ